MTQRIIWDSSFETSIPEIDDQHKRLVSIINELADAIGHTPKEILADTVARLKDYAQYHFRDEEQMMESAGYDGLQEHRDEHREFMDQIMLFDLDVILSSDGLAWDMLHYLRGWLTTHILVTDMKFANGTRP